MHRHPLFRVLLLAVAAASARAGAECSIAAGSSATMADMHDGDQKRVAVSADGSTLTITPFGNNQTWTTSAALSADCTAVVDFNVPGKPSPPPCNLLGTLYSLTTPGSDTPSAALGFTDKTGTITDDPNFPLNYWIQFA